MKRKSGSEKNRRHVVAWINKAEWDQVLEYLYSSDTSLQKHAVHRISAWKSRFAGSTPVAVECTADLVRCQVLDRGGKLDGHELVLLYGTALVRFVNLITERQQGRVARPLRRLAGNLNIPEWIVNLRHDFTHSKIPSLKWCRKGCKAVLEWLQQEYWSRQLSNGDWDAPSDGEDDDEFRDELVRQKEMESYKRVRELLISYESEQYQALEGGGREKWAEPFAEINWILAEIKQAALESCALLLEVLLEEGFLVPTSEQLQTLRCVDVDSTDPRIPRAFLRFWLPLLRMLNSPAFLHLLLEKLFAELKLLAAEPNEHRAYFVSAWIAEVLLCNGKRCDFHFETKAQRKARLKDRIFVNRIQLRWQQLLAACLDSASASTPHLLRLILDDMEHPLPAETQRNLLTLCSIYTQPSEPLSEPPPSPRRDQPIYTLESLREKLQQSKQRRKVAERSGANREHRMSEGDADRVRLLRGSWWQLCTENVAWSKYPLGKVPGQSADPSCLMLDSFSSVDVPDQPVELEMPVHSAPRTSPALKCDGLLWTAGDVGKLKSGIKLF